MSQRWIEAVKKATAEHHSFLEYASSHWNYHTPLYFRIKQVAQPHARILDVGCGCGPTAIYLQESGYKAVGIDNEAEIIEQAKKNAKHLNSLVTFEVGDALDLSKYYQEFDLVLSMGLVEHFEREKAIALLREQAKCAQYVMTVIPTKYIKYLGFAIDEQFYTIGGLTKIFRDSGLEVISKFGYGDISVPVFYKRVRHFLPHGFYRLLQYYFSYALEIGCLGKVK